MNLKSRLTLTGLGLVLAAASAASAQASGWDCNLNERGEWLCQSGTGVTIDAGADVAATPAQKSSEDAAIEAIAYGRSNDSRGDDTEHSTDPNAPTHITRINDDWVPLDKLTSEQKKQLADAQKHEATMCCGMYVDPTESGDKTHPENAELQAHADKTYTDINNQLTRLKGNVQVSQGYRYLRADTATLRKEPRQVALRGNVALREPGLLLTGSRADMQVDENTAQMENVQYLMHKAHIHGKAQSLSRSNTGVVALTKASYSYCPVGSEQWVLNAGSLTLDPNDSQGRAHDVTLRVKGVPVFYTPYLQFPIGDQRMSGFLVPSFGFGKNGLDLSTPYYFNLAPNYDLILTPRFMSDRGLMLTANGRYMTEHTQGSALVSILPGDQDAGRSIDSDRWFLNFKQNGADKHWESMVDYSSVSDSQYFHDLGSSGIHGTNTAQLRQQAQFDFLPDDHWRLGIMAKDFQTLNDSRLFDDVDYAIRFNKLPAWYRTVLQNDQLIEPHEVLPSLFADGNYNLDNGLVANLHHSFTRFDHKDAISRYYTPADEAFLQNQLFFNTNISDVNPVTHLTAIDPFTRQQQYWGERAFIAGSRMNLDYNLALPLRSDGAFFTPKIGVRHVSQSLDQTTFFTPNGNPSASAAYVSLDSGLIFERNTRLFGNDYTQTLEPRLFYYYSNPGSQKDIYNFDSNALSMSYSQLFRDYRLAGEDYIDDSNQLSFGVSSRLLSPSTGRELLRLGIGQAFYLAKRDVVLEDNPEKAQYERNRSRSALVFDAAARLSSKWDVRTETLWNEDTASRERQSVALRYRDGEGMMFNTGYQYIERENEWQPAITNPYTGNLINPSGFAPDPNFGTNIDRTVQQFYVSGAYPLNNQWSLIGHWNRDATNSRNLETIAGVEYDSCCWTVRVVARQWVVNQHFVSDTSMQNTDNGIFLQVQFKSLGNVGDSVDSMLSNSIFGYDDRYKTND
ncbi:MAG: LPS-assembly protein LptD [Pseudomonadales bacterium]|jgi:LPS-assembly protein|nr:LPS-assembly protein LptD [Pseudomonadales bacterium]